MKSFFRAQIFNVSLSRSDKWSFHEMVFLSSEMVFIKGREKIIKGREKIEFKPSNSHNIYLHTSHAKQSAFLDDIRLTTAVVISTSTDSFFDQENLNDLKNLELRY